MQALVADIVDGSCVDGPGNRYVVFLQGCTFNCLACHNPHTIATCPTSTSRWVDLDRIHTDIARKAPFLSGVTVSGGEPTAQWHVVDELFRTLADDPCTAHLSRLVDSNGDADAHVWNALARTMHGAMIDLKAFDPDVHQMLTGRGNERVIAAIRQLSELDRLHEVRLLIIPGVNDTDDQLAATAQFLRSLDELPEVVVQGFRHEGTRPVAHRFRPATEQDLQTVADALTRHGVPAHTIHIRHLSAPPPIIDVLGGQPKSE